CEIFKDIEDVGEDNSVSSLHLFFGNLELPPSSYDDSQEELWDEEEEPEEVLTVKLFNLSLAFPISTDISSGIIESKSVHSPVSSRRIPVFPSMTKLSGAVLSQAAGSGKHPIAFDSTKPIPAELDYKIHDKELARCDYETDDDITINQQYY
ncbi:hypothetical protein O181_114625, partial [Austropuccinia psidii MF-1]|nr:hypothetical protein [Austropuccinia psidii MF-1]